MRRKGIAAYCHGERTGGAIFDEPRDANLLGVLEPDTQGLSLDSLRRELRPLPRLLTVMAHEMPGGDNEE